MFLHLSFSAHHSSFLMPLQPSIRTNSDMNFGWLPKPACCLLITPSRAKCYAGAWLRKLLDVAYASGTFGLLSGGTQGKVSRSFFQIRQAMASLESRGQRESGKLLLTSVYALMNGKSPNGLMYISTAKIS